MLLAHVYVLLHAFIQTDKGCHSLKGIQILIVNSDPYENVSFCQINTLFGDDGRRNWVFSVHCRVFFCGNMCSICHPFSYPLIQTKKLYTKYFFIFIFRYPFDCTVMPFYFHIIINEFICNVQFLLLNIVVVDWMFWKSCEISLIFIAILKKMSEIRLFLIN